jgi:hypothetical protein
VRGGATIPLPLETREARLLPPLLSPSFCLRGPKRVQKEANPAVAER